MIANAEFDTGTTTDEFDDGVVGACERVEGVKGGNAAERAGDDDRNGIHRRGAEGSNGRTMIATLEHEPQRVTTEGVAGDDADVVGGSDAGADAAGGGDDDGDGVGMGADGLLVVALAGGATVGEAARVAGVGERTVYRRRDEPGFRARVNAARAAIVEDALGRMAGSMTAAADTLRGLLSAEKEAVRLGAARSILELGTRLREAAELERRIADLEQLAEQRIEKLEQQLAYREGRVWR